MNGGRLSWKGIKAGISKDIVGSARPPTNLISWLSGLSYIRIDGCSISWIFSAVMFLADPITTSPANLRRSCYIISYVCNSKEEVQVSYKEASLVVSVTPAKGCDKIPRTNWDINPPGNSLSFKV